MKGPTSERALDLVFSTNDVTLIAMTYIWLLKYNYGYIFEWSIFLHDEKVGQLIFWKIDRIVVCIPLLQSLRLWRQWKRRNWNDL